MKPNKFYVTTPIYYVTAAPHLGSLYSTLLADVAARYHRMMGQEVFFLTGTDEHGQKVAEAAKKAGKNPKEFVDGFIDSYTSMWKLYEIEYTKFIRTTDEYHVHAVQTWISRLLKQGDIYKGSYTGWYCTPCETFVTEKDHPGAASSFAEASIKEVTCPSCLRPTNQISEECYFFRLSAYQDKLLQFFEKHPDFITPKERLHEVISFIKDGLKDLSISRTTVSWGIPFPGDSKHVTYVWADALNNYITAIGYGRPEGEKDLHFWWPADLQILGKDIVRFHAIYWPAFLMASGLEMPKKLLVHGWIKVGDAKMSKSLGNAVDPRNIQGSAAPSSSGLTRGPSNINSSWSSESIKLQQQCEKMIQESLALIEQGFFYRAVNHVWEYINHVNSYFHASQPWKLATSNPEKFQETIAATVYSLRAIAVMLWPVMPQKMEMLLESIGYTLPEDQAMIGTLGSWNDRLTIKKIETLFKKYEKIMEEKTIPAVAPEVEINYA
ncbi:MAG: methionine--tRNA ligase, partial [Candidatus Dependentiae bacterium]|nr:methionine--tRNA ligase [Candidatus Dependentiae bacterium]